ncbi:MAG: 3'(2'),5'-bisphosphate nucleotidase [Anaerolineales bacterium]
MFNLNTPEILFTLHAVQGASALVKKVQEEMATGALTKGDRSPVTVADYAAQALIGHLLAGQFPDDPLVGEEDSSALRTDEQRETLERITYFVGMLAPGVTNDAVCRWIDRGSAKSAPRYWTIDPIDGTKGFLRGMQYAVALALVEGGKVQVSALGCPNLNVEYLVANNGRVPMQKEGAPGSLVIAVRGEGAWATPLTGKPAFTRLHASARTEPSQARLLRSYEKAHTNTGKIGDLVQALNVGAEPIGMDSQAKYAVLAAGQGDMLVRLLSSRQPNYKEKIWDQAAGSLVVEEAGGWITDLHGRTLDFTQGRTLARNRGILASNGHLHTAALEALRAIEA